jgi:hypothetical protein
VLKYFGLDSIEMRKRRPEGSKLGAGLGRLVNRDNLCHGLSPTHQHRTFPPITNAINQVGETARGLRDRNGSIHQIIMKSDYKIFKPVFPFWPLNEVGWEAATAPSPSSGGAY